MIIKFIFHSECLDFEEIDGKDDGKIGWKVGQTQYLYLLLNILYLRTSSPAFQPCLCYSLLLLSSLWSSRMSSRLSSSISMHCNALTILIVLGKSRQQIGLKK